MYRTVKSGDQKTWDNFVNRLERTIASGLLGMFQYAGQSLGVAFGGAVFATFATASGSALHSLPSPADMSSLASDPAAQEAMGNAFIDGMQAALFAIPLPGIGGVLSVLHSNPGQQLWLRRQLTHSLQPGGRWRGFGHLLVAILLEDWLRIHTSSTEPVKWPAH